MKVDLTASGVVALVGLGVVGLVVWKLYSSRNQIAAAVNPTSDQNLAYQGANRIVQAATGEKDTTLGVWLWEVFNGGREAEELASRNHYDNAGKGASGSGAQEPDYSDPTQWFPN
jgi:hypothetical protein